MKKMMGVIFVALLCCFVISGDAEKVSAEMDSLNQELTKSRINMTDMLYYTEAESGETTLIDMTVISDEIEADKDYTSSGNMSSVPRWIIGNDERVSVDNANTYPYSAIALIEVVYTNGTKVWGTGYFVSGKTMLTAAHVLVEGNWQIQRINVYKSCNGYATTPTAQASSWYICANYDDSAAFDCDDDYAILRFTSNVSQTWFGLYVPADASSLLGTGRHVAGYYSDKSNIQTSYFPMYTAGGEVVDYSLYRIEHQIDTEAGVDGAPVYRYNYSLYQWEAIAIHVGSYSQVGYEGTMINCGRRITSELYNWLLNNSFISA